MNEKVYVAMEATKLFVNQQNINGYSYSKEEIMNIYNTFFDKLKLESRCFR